MAMARSMSITVNNSSGASLMISGYRLSDGTWEGPAPEVRSMIGSGSTASFINGADTPFKAVGGTLGLMPDTGGSIELDWSFPPTAEPAGNVSSDSLSGLSVTYDVVGRQTQFPILQVVVMNAAA